MEAELTSWFEANGCKVFGRRGDELKVACPFCADDKPDHFGFNLTKRKWGCFKCGEAGRSIRQLAHKLGWELTPSLLLWRPAGGAVRASTVAPEPVPVAPDADRVRLLTDAAAICHEAMGALAREYLLSRLPPEAIDRFNLGEVPTDLLSLLPAKGYTIRQCEEAGLIRRDRKDKPLPCYLGAIVIPCPDADGRIVSLLYRLTDADAERAKGQRYFALKGTRRDVFNPAASQGTHEVYLTEGPMDAITLSARGLPALALPSATIIPSDLALLLDGKAAVYLVMDNDDAGEKARVRVRRKLPKIPFVDVRLPTGTKDVNEYFVKGGHSLEDFKALAKSAPSVSSPADATKRIEGKRSPVPPAERPAPTTIEGTLPEVSPAMGFSGGYAYLAIMLNESRTHPEHGEYIGWTKKLLRSDGELFPVLGPADLKDPTGRWQSKAAGILLDRPMELVGNGWPYGTADLPYTIAWYRGRVGPGHVWGSTFPVQAFLFARVRQKWQHYVHLRDPAAHDILALYTFLSYFSHAFEALGYLHVNGPKATGKTTIAKLFEALGFNAQLWVNASSASIFRTVDQLGGLLIFDEMEHRASKEHHHDSEAEILKSGYKRGARVVRVEGDKKKYVQSFNVYGPKVICNIEGLDDVLSDRAITIRTQPGGAAGVPTIPPRVNEPALVSLRGALHCIAMSRFASVVKTRERVEVTSIAGLSGRHYELFFPLMVLAEWIDPHGQMGLRRTVLGYAAKTATERKLSRVLSRESRVALAADDALDARATREHRAPSSLTEGWLSMDEIRDRLEDDDDDLTPKQVGRILGRIRLDVNRRREVTDGEITRKVREYWVSRKALAPFLESVPPDHRATAASTTVPPKATEPPRLPTVASPRPAAPGVRRTDKPETTDAGKADHAPAAALAAGSTRPITPSRPTT